MRGGPTRPGLCLLVLVVLVEIMVSIRSVSAGVCVNATQAAVQFCTSVVGHQVYMTDLNSTATGTAIESALLSADNQATSMATSLEGVLRKYDCTRPYSYYGCDDCRMAYKEWACRVVFPPCGSGNNLNTSAPLCLSTCNSVMQRCPYVLDFQCPRSDAEFTDYTSSC